MRSVIQALLLVLLISPVTAQNSSNGPRPFEFKDGDRVVFLGDTWMEREQQDSYIESRITSRLEGKKVIFRNLAWSADTVLGESRASFDPPEKGFDRLKEQIVAIKPTVVFLGYGMAESFKGAAGVPHFKDELNKLVETIGDICKPEAVRFVFLTPLHHENLGAPLPDPTQHNEQLKLYADALKEIAQQRNSVLIDLFSLSGQFEKGRNNPHLTENGIHPTPFGYWQIAYFIEQGLGIGPKSWRSGISTDGILRSGSTGFTLAGGTIQRNGSEISFTGKDAFMCIEPPPGGKPVDYKGSCLLQFVGLASGDYMLTVDGEPAAKASAGEWEKTVRFHQGPAFDQLRAARGDREEKRALLSSLASAEPDLPVWIQKI